MLHSWVDGAEFRGADLTDSLFNQVVLRLVVERGAVILVELRLVVLRLLVIVDNEVVDQVEFFTLVLRRVFCLH